MPIVRKFGVGLAGAAARQAGLADRRLEEFRIDRELLNDAVQRQIALEGLRVKNLASERAFSLQNAAQRRINRTPERPRHTIAGVDRAVDQGRAVTRARQGQGDFSEILNAFKNSVPEATFKGLSAAAQSGALSPKELTDRLVREARDPSEIERPARTSGGSTITGPRGTFTTPVQEDPRLESFDSVLEPVSNLVNPSVAAMARQALADGTMSQDQATELILESAQNTIKGTQTRNPGQKTIQRLQEDTIIAKAALATGNPLAIFNEAERRGLPGFKDTQLSADPDVANEQKHRAVAALAATIRQNELTIARMQQQMGTPAGAAVLNSTPDRATPPREPTPRQRTPEQVKMGEILIGQARDALGDGATNEQILRKAEELARQRGVAEQLGVQ